MTWFDRKLIIAADNMDEDSLKDFLKSLLSDPELIQYTVIKLNDLIALKWLNWLSQIISDLKEEGYQADQLKRMFDYKWNDISNTMKNYLEQIAVSWIPWIEYITVMANTWEKILQDIIQKRNSLGLSTKIIAVTVLTDLDDFQTKKIYGNSSLYQVLELAGIAINSWVDGIVCSAKEAKAIKSVYEGDYQILTPGIRPLDSNLQNDDQQRVTTPEYAIKNWSDIPIIWRPITQSSNPLKKIQDVLEEIQNTISDWKFDSFRLEKYLFQRDYENLLKYVGAYYKKPEGWKYVRLTSGLISDAYINIWILERYPKILEAVTKSIYEKLASLDLLPDVVLGAEKWSIRISSHLGLICSSEASLYVEKDTNINDEEYITFKRHDMDIKGKKVVLSEDVITKGSTLEQMISLVEQKQGEVVAVTCVVNRFWKDNFNWIPIISCYTPPEFQLFYDQKSPDIQKQNIPSLPENSEVVEKPKNQWEELIKSMF